MARVVRRDPEIRGHFPVWCHHHGFKMAVELLDLDNCTLIISGSAAKVVIKKSSLEFPDSGGWLVNWEVIQSKPRGAGSRGRTLFTDKQLMAAFGLTQYPGEFGDWIIEQYGADSAEQGKYIRWREFLNIPCPGTGHDGDPNVSINIDEDMIAAVQKLLGLE